MKKYISKNHIRIIRFARDGIFLSFLSIFLCLFLKCGQYYEKEFDLADENGTLHVETQPIGFTFSNNYGELIFSTHVKEGQGQSSFLCFGVYDSLKSYHFYDPSNTQEAPYGAKWSCAGNVKEKEEIQGGVRLHIEITRDVGKELLIDVTHDVEVGFRFMAKVIEPAGIGYFRTNFSASANEHFYGLGERFDKTDARGSSYEMFTDISGKIASGINEVHVPVPFFVSTLNYGVFFDDPHPSFFDMDSSDSGAVSVTYSVWDTLSWYLITGKNPIEVATRYGKLTGPAVLPPVWAFAPMQWRNELPDGSAFLEDARALRLHDIPTTTLWIDNPWQTAYNTFVFNEVQFPETENMLSSVFNLGFKVIVWSTPYLDNSDDSQVREGMWSDTGGLFEQADESGYFVKNISNKSYIMPWKNDFTGGRIDFTNPDAVLFWKNLIHRVTSLGITGFKLDYGEEIVPGLLGARPGFFFYDGSDEQTMHKLYSVLYHKTYREKCLEDKGDCFIIGRSSTYGGQKYVDAIWPGDLDNNFSQHGEPEPEKEGVGAVGGLPAAICALQNLSVSGFPNFGSDTGGYRGGAPSTEVLIRWAQHTALTPIMQLGGGGSSHNPWDSDLYDPMAIEIYRKYAKLHTRLFPLFYTLAKKASIEGTPPIVPIGMFDPSFAEAHLRWDEYIIGKNLLVAPVYEEGAVSREVLFPAGTWVNWWTSQSMEGGTVETIEAPLDTLPLFIAKGSIIPMLSEDIDTFTDANEPDVITLDDRKDILYLHIITNESESTDFELFDGTIITSSVLTEPESIAIEIFSGDWFKQFIVELDWRNSDTLTLEKPSTITRNGILLESNDDFMFVYERNCTDCWSWDTEKELLVVSMGGGGKLEIK